MVKKERKILKFIKEEKVKILNKSEFNNNNKVIKMKYIIIYGLNNKGLLLNFK